MTPAEITFAQELVAEARASGHPWPGYAAAEAFLNRQAGARPTVRAAWRKTPTTSSV